jgi:hypothetical protein
MHAVILAAVFALVAPVSAQRTTEKVVTMDPTDHWTDTGVTVRAGDYIRLDASGTIRMSPGGDAVGPEGSRSGRASGAPFPGRPAGALIARIGDDGAWIFVGARQRTLRAPRDGTLHLAVNDDYYDDNTGELRVAITTGPDSGGGGQDTTETAVTMDPTDHWTNTGIMVRAGDVIRLNTSGSVRTAPDAQPVGPEGARSARASGAPLPNRPAGALIARIGDDGPWMFVGARQGTIRADRDGTLHLAVNDDYYDDNTGELRVAIVIGGSSTGMTRPTPLPESGGAGATSRTVRVDPRTSWTDTGISVRQGDVIRLDASGSLRTTPRGEIVGPQGSATGRAASAALPDGPAGALIARIGDDGEPMLVGSERTIRADRAGRLWLGVNDDRHDDNSGALRVVIQVRRGR